MIAALTEARLDRSCLGHVVNEVKELLKGDGELSLTKIIFIFFAKKGVDYIRSNWIQHARTQQYTPLVERTSYQKKLQNGP